VHFCEVAITSVIACSNAKKVYFIYVLHTGITYENQDKLTGLSTNNVTVQCIDVAAEVSNLDCNHKMSAHFTAEIVSRLLISEIFPQYDKIIYLDCDLVVLKDISELYEIDIEDNVIGAATIIPTEFMINYLDKLNVGFPNKDYFATGALIINTKRFAQMEVKEKCFKLLDGKQNYLYPDQDSLNIICHGNVKFLDMRWNIGLSAWSTQAKTLSEYGEAMIDTASDPWILHYTSYKKPWV